MKHAPAWYLKKNCQFVESTIFKYLFWVSFFISAALNPLLFLRLSVNVREVLPHVITFESCNLALLAIIFSLALGLKDGAVYKVLMKQDINLVKSAYWRVFFCCFSSTLTIILAIFILSIKGWTILWIKAAMQTIGLVACIYSILGTLHLLYYFTYLMVEEAKRNRTKTIEQENQ